MTATPLDRALLSLHGLALGDAFGERFFVNPAQVDHLIDVRALAAGPWLWTDDTAMAISVVETLAQHGEIDQEALAQLFAARYRADPSRGYGPGAHRILSDIADGQSWRDAAGSAFAGQGSYGNGGAMRAPPIGAFFAEDLARVLDEARKSAEVTHAHPEGQAGAMAVAAATALAVTHDFTQPPAAFIEAVAKLTPTGATRDGLERAASFPPEFSVLAAAPLLGNGSMVSSQDTVPMCVWAAARFASAGWEEALWETVGALGDRDTTCAIVGGILAVPAGRAAFPPAWVEACEPLPDFSCPS